MTPTMHADTKPFDRSELAAWYEAALEDQERSGLSVAEYAEELEVSAATLYSWRRRLAAGVSASPGAGASGLVRVQVRRGGRETDDDVESLVIHLGNRRSIAVPRGFDAGELARVIEVLQAC